MLSKIEKIIAIVAFMSGTIAVNTCCFADAKKESGIEWASNGQARYGPFLFISDEKGGLSLIFNNRPLIENMGVIITGANGYTPFTQLKNVKIEKNKGMIKFVGKLDNVTFTQTVTSEGNRLKFVLKKEGKWSKEGIWSSFHIHLPMIRSGNNDFIVGGKKRSYPAMLPDNNLLDSNVKKVALRIKRSEYSLVFECDGNLDIYDGRKWQSNTYDLNFSFGQNIKEQFTLYLNLPTIAIKPSLRISRIGYPMKSDKRIIMEWPAGEEKPGDKVILKKKDGKTVKTGRFGKPVNFMGIQFSEFEFSEIIEKGEYQIIWSGGTSQLFPIKERLFYNLWQPTLDVFIPWQMSHIGVNVGKDAPAHPASHLDDAIVAPTHFPGVDDFRSYDADNTTFKAYDRIPSAIGGWYDAGDYDQNMAAQGFVVWQLALAYEEFNIQRDKATLNIENRSYLKGKPDGVPDILQQVEWGAYWLLSMQQNDGLFYVGVVAQPKHYGREVVPEKATDNKPGTGDERYVYVDYHPDSQLKGVIALAAAGRVLQKKNPQLSVKCINGATKGFTYFVQHKEVYRQQVYFDYSEICKECNSKKNLCGSKCRGRDGMVVSALVELYLTTKDNLYLKMLEKKRGVIEQMEMDWPSPYITNQGGFWFSAPFLARLAYVLPDSGLRKAAIKSCSNAVTQLKFRTLNQPWPFHEWSFNDWGNNGLSVGRIFDAYYLQKVIPDEISMENVLTSALWLFGLHPLNNYTFVSGIGYEGPRYLYNGQLLGRFGTKAKSVPGAIVPGITSPKDSGILVYADEPGQYQHNEACIYTAATYLFAVNALNNTGY